MIRGKAAVGDHVLRKGDKRVFLIETQTHLQALIASRCHFEPILGLQRVWL
jgi:hypothetical protein